MRNAIAAVIGFCWYLLLYVRYRGAYHAANRFYRAMQNPSHRMGRYARALAEGPLGRVVRDYHFMKEHVEREELSTRVIAEYSDDDLAGYGSAVLEKGGATLSEQQRGLILPLIQQVLDKHAQAGRNKTVIEIGTGNGDVIAYLAHKYPAHSFVGVDFSVTNARAKHTGLTNLTFKEAYALHALRNGTLNGDIAFGSSTFCVFTPKELDAYCRELHRVGFSEVLLNEPTWGGYEQLDDAGARSAHLQNSVWYHNYAGYLRKNGFDIAAFEFFHYKHPASARPDIFVTLLHARLTRQ